MEVQRNQILISQAIKKEDVLRAFRVAVLVGIILNFINNPGLFYLSFVGLKVYHIFLTFLVPFCVSLYSSVLASRKKCVDQT